MDFINLTNGIQAIKDYNLTDYRFIRIQSTHCEQKLWEDILMNLSPDFYMYAAIGERCVIYDYGAGKDIPRAVWQGLEWIKYVLSLRWYNEVYVPKGRARSSSAYFDHNYFKLSDRCKRNVDYYGRYKRGRLNISAVTGPTVNDGNKDYFINILC